MLSDLLDGDHVLPPFQLQACRATLGSGEEKEVMITADDHALSYFNVEENKYTRVKDGIIKVYISENADPNTTKLSTEINSKY